jgi:hypothetical protein
VKTVKSILENFKENKNKCAICYIISKTFKAIDSKDKKIEYLLNVINILVEEKKEIEKAYKQSLSAQYDASSEIDSKLVLKDTK